jgi:phenylpropionate dioxygenase-like ring-hydroxylating dioxygenase large terminal subunit
MRRIVKINMFTYISMSDILKILDIKFWIKGIAMSTAELKAPSSTKTCPGMQPCIEEAWYVAAFAHEIEKGRPFSREIMEQPLVLFRNEDDTVTALYDRCPHRAVPLSQGKVLASTIECAYHGFQFDRSGKCVVIPTQDKIPAATCTRSYSVVESMQFVWVWMGDPANADPALVPTYKDLGCDGEGWQFSPYFMMEIKSNYSLLFENLLDTSHISFLHIGGIDGGNMADAPYNVSTDGLQVTLERDLARDVAVPGTAKLFSLKDGQVFSRLLNSTSYLPNLHVISNTIGFPDEPEKQSNVRLNIMPITPGGKNALYQFVVVATSYPVDVTQDLKDQLWSVFTQDLGVLEGIQKGYDKYGPDMSEVSVKADAAGWSARRILAQLMAAEEPGNTSS